MPRSGSSMVAGLFARHGVWVGTQDAVATPFNPKGSYENMTIKRLLVKHFGHLRGLKDRPDHLPGGSTRFTEELVATIRDDGYTEGPWLFKGSCLYCRVFEELDPVYVTIRRPVEAIRNSVLQTGWMSRADMDASVALQSSVLDGYEEQGAPRIDSERLIDGDHAQIEQVFRHLGLAFDPAIAREWVDATLWHHR